MKGKEKTLRYSVLKFLLVYMMRITIPVNTTSILLINCSSNNWRGYSLKTYQWVLSRIINIRLRYKYTRFFVMNIIPPLIRFLSRYDCIVWLQMVFNLTEFWLYIQALNLMGIETYFLHSSFWRFSQCCFKRETTLLKFIWHFSQLT